VRLTEYEIESIYKVFKEVFDNGRIYLFGSRVDNTLKGGDIYIFLVVVWIIL